MSDCQYSNAELGNASGFLLKKIRPFHLTGIETALNLVGHEDQYNGKGFMRKQYVYGIDYRVGFGYGLWQKMIKMVNA